MSDLGMIDVRGLDKTRHRIERNVRNTPKKVRMGLVKMGLFDTPLISALNKSLDGLWKREQVIQDNLANYETPGYKSKHVTFEDSLQQALNRNDTRSGVSESIGNVRTMIGQSNDETLRLDGNGVDVEKENLEMLRTQYNFEYSQRLLNDTFSRLRAAINEGRK